TLIVLPPVPEWKPFFEDLLKLRRARVIERGGREFWVAAERLAVAESEEGPVATIRGWMESTGPMTIAALAARLALPRDTVESAIAKLESGGQVLRGRFTPASKADSSEVEWCNRPRSANPDDPGRARRDLSQGRCVMAPGFARTKKRLVAIRPRGS